jgi:hypothetical protein
MQPSAQRRPRHRQLTRLLADGTGQSEVEIQALIVSTVVSVLAAGAVTAAYGVVRLLDFLADA